MTAHSHKKARESTDQVLPFAARHNGPTPADVRTMLTTIGVPSVETLINQTVPEQIRLSGELDLPSPSDEHDALEELRSIIEQNVEARSFIGQGYYGCRVPAVIQRNMFENPAWYTAYTPYQPEISQGRLEMLFNFQTLVSELTGLPVANASLLDEATAVAEAAGIAYRHHRMKRHTVKIASPLHSQSAAVLATRMEPLGIKIAEGEPDEDTAAVVFSWPDTFGCFEDPREHVDAAKKAGALVIVVTDPLALTLLEPPGHWGADIVVGSAQRFGVPMGFGGPHAAYMGVSQPLTRLMPGRLVGESVDARGNPAYRLALQTREQHIRRDKATSNICTAQALLANMSAAYAIWHGPDGLRAIAQRAARYASRFAESLVAAGFELVSDRFFDTLTVRTEGKAEDIHKRAHDAGYLLRTIDRDRIGLSFDETTSEADFQALCEVFGIEATDAGDRGHLPPQTRHEAFLTQPIFNAIRSETEMMRYLRKLADMDLALDRAMIPLGSCTMKLNAAAELAPVSWRKIGNIHPLAPKPHSTGYRKMIADLESWLCEITGFAAVSLQPNAGSQGEFAGLAAIRHYHASKGDEHRDVCLIPSSAHGTNPASASMSGMRIVMVACTEAGDVDIHDLKAKAKEHEDKLAALMITYPSTHGVFETQIKDICEVVHDHGGQVYFDGANLNAMIGLAKPFDIGADVCHMNLHKTFCIPHGGGGPGIGPIGVAAHLKPFLPGDPLDTDSNAVAAAMFGSASILPISWMYIRMMGAAGLKSASQIAVLSANYLAARLEGRFDILYRGHKDRVAHECIVDTRPFKESAGVSVEDIAKRLIDYGFHAPTMSWPVAGTLMIEPTESEPLAELDRFCDAMLSIREEIAHIETGEWTREDNPLVNAPHTAVEAVSWEHGYDAMTAVAPTGPAQLSSKYWPPVARVDNVFGDRNLVCTCPPIEQLAS
ncbi:aminomethyl-transferring glycine dehydrogenase [Hoeflea prorocentri]|uniref:Glycine dehydrogenase (decarboxylating) n=1 Tax=Hoeflea prorocentri TaxID=1922333 RepID=A0A9X3UHH3_9HYPH|nr:aminomethyl-transferring glycine dehydrogenase [Hoeflea prorocentri]MCY6380933.1 aminomethyl-transferring glycine dehydrogenase [Hoeflea prorocentri]MDA5398733.1 aminomethyl-transferring glycine dehydrogenase [Hoeflea prorocentri]